MTELERTLTLTRPRRHWWHNLNLSPWMGDEPVLASVAVDMPFAQAIAAERALRRGVRQRVAVRRNYGGTPCLFVEDAETGHE